VKKKAIRPEVRSRLKKLKPLIRKIKKDFRTADIHRFRVEIKKLTVLLRLSAAGGKDPHRPKLLEYIKEWYDALGDVRVWQLQQQFIREVAAAEGSALPYFYLNMLNMREAAGMTRAAGLLWHSGRRLKKARDKILALIPAQTGKRMIKQFLLAEQGNLRALLASGGLAVTSLHEVRKKLKELLYTRAYTGKYLSRFFPYLPREQEIVRITGLLGDLHDYHTAIGLLAQEHTDGIANEAERDQLLNIKKIWVAKSDLLERQARSGIAGLLSPDQIHPRN
jgi:CHAD domain-containing protein